MTAEEFLIEYGRLTDIEDFDEIDGAAWEDLKTDAVHMLHDLLMTGSVNP